MVLIQNCTVWDRGWWWVRWVYYVQGVEKRLEVLRSTDFYSIQQSVCYSVASPCAKFSTGSPRRYLWLSILCADLLLTKLSPTIATNHLFLYSNRPLSPCITSVPLDSLHQTSKPEKYVETRLDSLGIKSIMMKYS